MQSPLDTHLTVQGPTSLFLLCDNEEVQHYVDPHMDPQQGKKGACTTQRSTWKSFGITVLEQIYFAFPCPLDSGKKEVIKELK